MTDKLTSKRWLRTVASIALCLSGQGCSDAEAETEADASAFDAALEDGGFAVDTGAHDAATRDAGLSTDDAGRGASTPDTGPSSCQLTDWEQMMLDDHNQWRAAVNPPAENMLRIRWDTAIAANAANWVASCDPDWPHSPEAERSNVGGYDVLGENLHFCAGTGCDDNPEVTDNSGRGNAEGWWEERLDYDYQNDRSTGGQIAHYTQLTSSNVYAIGCATQRCGAPGPNGWSDTWWWTICQYGPRGQAYWRGTKPYEVGGGGLTEPPATVFDDHPALCR